MAKDGRQNDVKAFTYRVEKVEKILDGDTIDVTLDLGFKIYYRQRVRMVGIDTPESRTRDLEEKKFGLLSKRRLKYLIKNAGEVVIRTEIDKLGKFGRVLGQVWCDGVNVNQLLIDEGLAVAYHGQNRADVAAAHLANRRRLIAEGKA